MDYWRIEKRKKENAPEELLDLSSELIGIYGTLVANKNSKVGILIIGLSHSGKSTLVSRLVGRAPDYIFLSNESEWEFIGDDYLQGLEGEDGFFVGCDFMEDPFLRTCSLRLRDGDGDLLRTEISPSPKYVQLRGVILLSSYDFLTAESANPIVNIGNRNTPSQRRILSGVINNVPMLNLSMVGLGNVICAVEAVNRFHAEVASGRAPPYQLVDINKPQENPSTPPSSAPTALGALLPILALFPFMTGFLPYNPLDGMSDLSFSLFTAVSILTLIVGIMRINWTDEHIDETFRNPPESVKDPANSSEWVRAGYSGMVTAIYRRYGSWQEWLKHRSLLLSSVEDKEHIKRFEDVCLGEIVVYQLWMPPPGITDPRNSEQWHKIGNTRIHNDARKRFGSWGKAVKVAGMVSFRDSKGEELWQAKYNNWDVVRDVSPELVEIVQKGKYKRVVLAPEQDAQLSQEVQKGNQAAHTALFVAYRCLVFWRVKNLLERNPELKRYKSDLIDAGLYGVFRDGIGGGLKRAVELFNPQKNSRFSSYALIWIRNSVSRKASQVRKIKEDSLQEPVYRDSDTSMQDNLTASDIDPLSMLIARQSKDDLVVLLESLPLKPRDRERNIQMFVRVVFNGEKERHICKEYGLTNGGVSYFIVKIKKLLLKKVERTLANPSSSTLAGLVLLPLALGVGLVGYGAAWVGSVWLNCLGIVIILAAVIWLAIKYRKKIAGLFISQKSQSFEIPPEEELIYKLWQALNNNRKTINLINQLKKHQYEFRKFSYVGSNFHDRELGSLLPFGHMRSILSSDWKEKELIVSLVNSTRRAIGSFVEGFYQHAARRLIDGESSFIFLT